MSSGSDEQGASQPSDGEIPWQRIHRLDDLWASSPGGHGRQSLQENCLHYRLPAEGPVGTLRTNLFLHLCGITEDYAGAATFKALHEACQGLFYMSGFNVLSFLNKAAMDRFPEAWIPCIARVHAGRQFIFRLLTEHNLAIPPTTRHTAFLGIEPPLKPVFELRNCFEHLILHGAARHEPWIYIERALAAYGVYPGTPVFQNIGRHLGEVVFTHTVLAGRVGGPVRLRVLQELGFKVAPDLEGVPAAVLQPWNIICRAPFDLDFLMGMWLGHQVHVLRVEGRRRHAGSFTSPDWTLDEDDIYGATPPAASPISGAAQTDRPQTPPPKAKGTLTDQQTPPSRSPSPRPGPSLPPPASGEVSRSTSTEHTNAENSVPPALLPIDLPTALQQVHCNETGAALSDARSGENATVTSSGARAARHEGSDQNKSPSSTDSHQDESPIESAVQRAKLRHVHQANRFQPNTQPERTSSPPKSPGKRVGSDTLPDADYQAPKRLRHNDKTESDPFLAPPAASVSDTAHSVPRAGVVDSDQHGATDLMAPLTLQWLNDIPTLLRRLYPISQATRTAIWPALPHNLSHQNETPVSKPWMQTGVVPDSLENAKVAADEVVPEASSPKAARPVNDAADLTEDAAISESAAALTEPQQ